MDLVPNHTSDRHPWFVDARSSRTAEHRDWYVWADAKADGSPPNNWRSSFGGPAWTWDETTEQYYLHHFLAEQPDLNWWNPAVAEAFEEILRFWFDLGIAGFRIDVAHALVHDRELRDDSLALETDDPRVRAHGLRSDHSMNRPEGHGILGRWRTIADGYEPRRVLLGETWVTELEALARFYGTGDDELHLALNVPFEHSIPGPAMREIVERTAALLPPSAWPLWNGSNHDAGRFPTPLVRRGGRSVRATMLLLLTLRGTPLLYYGDEIGMRDVDVPRDRLKRPGGHPPLAGAIRAGTRAGRRCSGRATAGSRAPTSSRGSRWVTRPPGTSRISGRTRTRSSTCAGTSSASGAIARTSAPGRTKASRRRPGSGRGGGGQRRRWP